MKWKWGNFPVPVQYLAGLFLGAGLQALFGQSLFSNPLIGDLLGFALLAMGIGTAAWSVLAAGEVDIEAPQQLIKSGPYARSRNPMMVAWIMFYLGVGLILNSIWILMLLPLVVLLTHFVDIPREEVFLTDEFGDEYVQYRRRVRMYL